MKKRVTKNKPYEKSSIALQMTNRKRWVAGKLIHKPLRKAKLMLENKAK